MMVLLMILNEGHILWLKAIFILFYFSCFFILLCVSRCFIGVLLLLRASFCLYWVNIDEGEVLSIKKSYQSHPEGTLVIDLSFDSLSSHISHLPLQNMP